MAKCKGTKKFFVTVRKSKTFVRKRVLQNIELCYESMEEKNFEN